MSGSQWYIVVCLVNNGIELYVHNGIELYVWFTTVYSCLSGSQRYRVVCLFHNGIEGLKVKEITLLNPFIFLYFYFNNFYRC